MQKWNEILAFCSSSALGCTGEPPLYGSLRLIECLDRLIRFGQEYNLNHSVALTEIADYIEENKMTCMYDEENFEKMLENIVLSLLAITEDE